MISLWEIATSVVLQPPRNDCEFWRLLRWLFYDLLAKSEVRILGRYLRKGLKIYWFEKDFSYWRGAQGRGRHGLGRYCGEWGVSHLSGA